MAQQDVLPQFVEHVPEHKFLVHVAVDFGTDGVALAYAFGEANKITAHTEWSSTKYAPKCKPKTIILLDEECEAIGFGKDAKHTYMVTKKMKNKWMLFERFKMSLYHQGIPTVLDPLSPGTDNEKKVEIKNTLTATNGKIVKASIVFIAAFKHLHNEAKTYLKRNKFSRKLFTTLTPKDWQWIITVPAIWQNAAKCKMRQWAIDAGLVDPDIEEQCKIVYEPDCASLALQYEINRSKSQICNPTDEAIVEDTLQSNDITFKKGEKYILVDAGGGTVDVTSHEILGSGDGEYGVKEILAPSGGAWGSMYIDHQFEILLTEVFSAKWMTQFKEEQANVYTELLDNFQHAKEEFHKQDKHYVRIPYDFIGFMQEKLEEKEGFDDDDIETFVSSRTAFGVSNLLSLSEEFLKIDQKGWKIMFNRVIQPTIDHIHKLLNEPKLMRNCKYLCLAGGLSSSLYFQSKMEEEFGPQSKYKMHLMIPMRPILSVVEGAAYFGIVPNYIKARVLKYTYGYVVDYLKDNAVANNISADYIEQNSYYNEYRKRWYVKNCFLACERSNKEMFTGQVITKYTTIRRNITTRVRVMFSEMEHPKIESDGKRLGDIIIDWDDAYNTDDRITEEFHFYDTLIKVVVYPSKQPEKKQTRYITNYQ